MKKAIVVLALLACIALPSFAAVTDTMFNIGLQNTSSVMTIDPEAKGDVFKFELSLQADFNMIFDDGPGFDVALTAEQNFSSLELGVYYAHKVDVKDNFDIVVMAGPTFQLTGDFAIGVDVKVNFLIDITKDFYVNVGTGALMDIVEFPKDADPVTHFAIEIPLPSVALGLRF